MAEKKPRLIIKQKVYKNVLMHENEIEEIELMEIRDDDVWVCSFPRSGTTLTQEMVYLIMTGDYDKAYSVQLDERFPLIEVKDDRYPYYKGLKYVEEMTSPRMIKSHLHHFLLPVQLRNGRGRIIYICRNPKDVVTSYYRLLQWMDVLDGEKRIFDAFFESFMKGTAYACPWPRHVLEYWEKRDGHNVLFLKYEEVVKDLPKTVRTIAKFLQKELTDDEIKKICEYCQFDNMKNNDTCNMSYYRTFKHVNDVSEGRFMNKGKPGAWREFLSPDKSARVDGMIREVGGSGLIIEEN